MSWFGIHCTGQQLQALVVSCLPSEQSLFRRRRRVSPGAAGHSHNETCSKAHSMKLDSENICRMPAMPPTKTTMAKTKELTMQMVGGRRLAATPHQQRQQQSYGSSDARAGPAHRARPGRSHGSRISEPRFKRFRLILKPSSGGTFWARKIFVEGFRVALSCSLS